MKFEVGSLKGEMNAGGLVSNFTLHTSHFFWGLGV